jgi:hypothetical protein
MLLAMRPFQRMRLDGSPRNRGATMPKPSPKQQRTQRGNGKLILNGRTARGRRLAELVKAYATGLPLEDEHSRGLVRSTAGVALEIERLEGACERGEVIDHLALTRMVGLRERNLEKLEALRVRARPPETTAAGGWTQPLWRYLHWMVWARERCGDASPKGMRRAELLAEYERLEAEGAFANDVR